MSHDASQGTRCVGLKGLLALLFRRLLGATASSACWPGWCKLWKRAMRQASTGSHKVTCPHGACWRGLS